MDLKFMCRGKYITLFANGRLVAMAVDTSLEGEGYVGLVSSCSSGDPSDHYWFGIEGFYKPLDVVVIRPGDTTASIMNQIADLYDGGEFFCNESGELVWGIYDETSVDLDATDGRIIMYEETKDVGDVVSIERCEGDNAYAEARDTAWGSELMGHNYAQISSNIYQTGQACMDAATAEMEKTHRVTAESVTIKGHPGLQLGDIVTVDEPGGGGKNRRVKGFSEVIGTVYETTLSELESLDAEEPDG
ncbi:MAG: hypothetical protein GWN77_06020 [Gammaproteobacteria bacterium]|nr:hypothetical protein [Gammaproteobacteria bacterium]